MDIEQTMEFILRAQAKHEASIQKHDEEIRELRSSVATLSDLVTEVCKRHPVIETMPSMQVILNGVAPGGNPLLTNGDQVVFLSTFTGG